MSRKTERNGKVSLWKWYWIGLEALWVLVYYHGLYNMSNHSTEICFLASMDCLYLVLIS